MSHTPGPWQVIDDTDVLALEGTPSAIVVASTKFFEGPSTSWERANARLIAAAPELLSVARSYLAALEAVANAIPEEGEGGDRGWWEHYRFVAAAVAKAVGVAS